MNFTAFLMQINTKQVKAFCLESFVSSRPGGLALLKSHELKTSVIMIKCGESVSSVCLNFGKHFGARLVLAPRQMPSAPACPSTRLCRGAQCTGS
jgi:hypothetical protein